MYIYISNQKQKQRQKTKLTSRYAPVVILKHLTISVVTKFHALDTKNKIQSC